MGGGGARRLDRDLPRALILVVVGPFF